MKRTALITLAITGLVLAGCGSDSGGGGLSGPQADAAERTIEEAQASGVELDEECVNDVVAQLTDDDAEAIASGSNADVSEDGSALSVQLIDCADPDAIADLFIEGMNESGQDFDEACVRTALEDFDMGELVTASQDGGSPPADVVAAMMECADLG